MPRRRVAERRAVLPDPVYNSPLVTKFINGIMWGGKRSLAEKTFYNALRQVGEKAGEEPLKVFKRAIENVRPRSEGSRVASEDPPIKFRLKFTRNAVARWQFAGLFCTRAAAARRP